MQSPSQKVVLADARSTAPVEPGETIQVKVEYEVKDPGQRMCFMRAFLLSLTLFRLAHVDQRAL